MDGTLGRQNETNIFSSYEGEEKAGRCGDGRKYNLFNGVWEYVVTGDQRKPKRIFDAERGGTFEGGGETGRN